MVKAYSLEETEGRSLDNDVVRDAWEIRSNE